jgi:hypothetical protein
VTNVTSQCPCQPSDIEGLAEMMLRRETVDNQIAVLKLKAHNFAGDGNCLCCIIGLGLLHNMNFEIVILISLITSTYQPKVIEHFIVIKLLKLSCY